MSGLGPTALEYKRARFTALFPASYRYTRSHFWLEPREPGLWRVGLTKFATRMLGEMVDFGFEIQDGSSVRPGQKIGWVEGFKAVSDLYSVADGSFVGFNPALERDITLINKDPHVGGWLYEVKGLPDPECVDATGYATILDATIDRLLAGQGTAEGSD